MKIDEVMNQTELNGEGNMKKVLKELADIKFALDQSSIIAITDDKGIICYVNDRFCEVSKYTKEELIGQNHRIIKSNVHSDDFFKNMWTTIKKGEVWKGEICNRAKDGTNYWVDSTIVPFVNEHGEPYQYIAIRNEISLRKKMEEEIKKSEEMYRLIAENSSDLISVIDPVGHFHYVSPSHKMLLGHEESTVMFSRFLHWVHEEDRERISQDLKKIVKGRKRSIQFECRILAKNGTYIDMETKANAISNEGSEKNSIVLVSRDITERKQSERMIYHLAYHDALTDLPNRRLFMNRLRDEVVKAKKSDSLLAVLFIDLDRFKYINDAWGHDTGDYILTEATRRIQKSLRSTDLIGRLGGDEFAVLLCGKVNQQTVERILKRIQKNFEEPVKIANHHYTMSCSIGVSLFPDHGNNADKLLTSADTALYVVKEQGRNGYAFFNPEMAQQSLERTLLENELRKAVELGQFHLDYQPKVDFSKGELIGVEALVRWNHPDLGTIPPNQFIPLAEETGLILPLGEWILRRGCEQNKEWQKKGYKPVRLSINLSSKQLEYSGMLKTIEEVLQDTALDPKWLELEVTESVFTDVAHAATLLKRIRELGVQISIDDFGAGYRAFSYMKHLPVDTLKIDASFIQDIHQSEHSQAIVKAVLTLAKTLRLNVIAEGIENKDQLAILNEDGCQQGQGFLFSKPLSMQDFEKYLQHRSQTTAHIE